MTGQRLSLRDGHDLRVSLGEPLKDELLGLLVKERLGRVTRVAVVMAEPVATLVAPAVPVALGHEALKLVPHELPHARLAGGPVLKKVRRGAWIVLGVGIHEPLLAAQEGAEVITPTSLDWHVDTRFRIEHDEPVVPGREHLDEHRRRLMTPEVGR